jgi:hypothetical protein
VRKPRIPSRARDILGHAIVIGDSITDMASPDDRSISHYKHLPEGRDARAPDGRIARLECFHAIRALTDDFRLGTSAA